MNPRSLWTCLLVGIALSAGLVSGQSELVKHDYYPAEFEFRELGAIRFAQAGAGLQEMNALEEAPLIAEAGFAGYTARTYALTAGGSLKIEFIELKDPRAAFSLITLLRKSKLSNGPPGDIWSGLEDGMVFSQGRFLVRLTGQAPAELNRRISASISNRIGTRPTFAPLLISHFPQKGYDPTSLRYFLGPKAFDAGAGKSTITWPVLPDMEMAQAHYTLPTGTGTFWLVNFPTSQMAEDYLDTLAGLRDQAAKKESPIYAKRAGPLLGLLEGNFDQASASALLDPLQFSYSIKWIYDRNQHAAKALWGVPMGILGTVVRSLLLTTLLCLTSIVGGLGFALFRLALRFYAPHNYLDSPERNEMIRLKLQ